MGIRAAVGLYHLGFPFQLRAEGVRASGKSAFAEGRRLSADFMRACEAIYGVVSLLKRAKDAVFSREQTRELFQHGKLHMRKNGGHSRQGGAIALYADFYSARVPEGLRASRERS